jgi:hypothetical protein
LLIYRKAKRIQKYRYEVIDVIKEIKVHSPEESETDPENPNGKREINVYNYSWRSDEVILFFFC